MKKELWNCLYACAGGLALYIIAFLGSTLSYMSISLLYTYLIVGSAITIFVILYRKATLLQRCLRFGVMILSFFIILALGGYIGLYRLVCQMFEIPFGSTNDDASGLLIAVILLSAVAVGFSVLFSIAIIETIRKIVRKRKKIQSSNEEIKVKDILN